MRRAVVSLAWVLPDWALTSAPLGLHGRFAMHGSARQETTLAMA